MVKSNQNIQAQPQSEKKIKLKTQKFCCKIQAQGFPRSTFQKGYFSNFYYMVTWLLIYAGG